MTSQLNGHMPPHGTSEPLDHQGADDEQDSQIASEEREATQSWATRAEVLKTTPESRKPIFLLAGGLAAAIGLFGLTTLVGSHSHKRSAIITKAASVPTHNAPEGAIAPLMDTVRNPVANNSGDQITASDISRTKAATTPPSLPIGSSSTSRSPGSGATLASVPPFESTQQHWEDPKPYGDSPKAPSSATQPQPQGLPKETSLVFVKKVEPPKNSTSLGKETDHAPQLELTPGTRIQARLETQVSSAVSAPVVAVVEYTYSLGERVVIPAGARVYGQLQQADRSGAISIKFNEIELLDGQRDKIDAIATSLELGPIKGTVSGKNTGRNFLVRTASGIGSIAAMVVGNNSSTAFSEDDLIRQRIAENVGNAGDTEIMNMAVTNRIVVSVPADTPIFIVFTKRSESQVSLRASPTPP